MQIWAESGKSALPICNYSQILYQFLTFTQNLKRSRKNLCMKRKYANSNVTTARTVISTPGLKRKRFTAGA